MRHVIVISTKKEMGQLLIFPLSCKDPKTKDCKQMNLERLTFWLLGGGGDRGWIFPFL